jgi:hypothetical protein
MADKALYAAKTSGRNRAFPPPSDAVILPYRKSG